MTLAALCGRGYKPLHESGSRQRFELLHYFCQSGSEDTFAPYLLPALKALYLSTEDLHGGFENVHHLATDFCLDVGRLTMLFLNLFLRLLAVLGVLLSTMTLVSSILTSKVFLMF